MGTCWPRLDNLLHVALKRTQLWSKKSIICLKINLLKINLLKINLLKINLLKINLLKKKCSRGAMD